MQMNYSQADFYTNILGEILLQSSSYPQATTGPSVVVLVRRRRGSDIRLSVMPLRGMFHEQVGGLIGEI